jgi:hypothetical protein
MTVETKVCKKCNVEYPLTSFYKAPKSKDKCRPWCKTCCSKSCAEYGKLHPRREPKERVLSNDEAIWYFWNNCRASRKYQPRDYPKKIVQIKRMDKRIIFCAECGEKMISYSNMFARIEKTKQICRKCNKRELNIFDAKRITANKQAAIERANKFKDALQDCEKFGTCDVLRAHHEAFVDDPDRLTSEFLIGLICGKEKVGQYNNMSTVPL